MSQTFEVPSAVQALARRTLSLHREVPLPDVHGIVMAEALAEGRLTREQVGKLARFHAVNARLAEQAVGLLRSSDADPTVRSYELHGGAAGQRFAERVMSELGEDADDLLEPTVELFQLQPDDIYPRFSLNAWRFEYGLDPTKAARFLEEYTRATGLNIDIPKAFGDAAGTVNRALLRRLHGEDPFRAAAKAMEVRDDEYRAAAEADLAEMSVALDEALPQSVDSTMSAPQAAKMVWPGFVAYTILGAERPELLEGLRQGSKPPPGPNQKPLSWTQYTDAERTYIAYFHPKGARYVDPAGTKFEGIEAEVYDLMHRIHFGKKVIPVQAQKLLGKMRRWTAQNKLAGSLFHVFNADWRKGAWAHILEAIPQDHDVREAFAEFAKVNPLPAGGVKLQQTLSAKKDRELVADFFGDQGYSDGELSSLKPVKFDDTDTGKAAQKVKTPVGVRSAIQTNQGTEVVLLGAFDTGTFGTKIVYVSSKGVVNSVDDDILADFLSNGSYSVSKAHADIPGSAYTTAAQPSPQPQEKPSAPDLDKIEAQSLVPEDIFNWTDETFGTPAAQSLLLWEGGSNLLDRYEDLTDNHLEEGTLWRYKYTALDEQGDLIRYRGTFEGQAASGAPSLLHYFEGPLQESGKEFVRIHDDLVPDLMDQQLLAPETATVSPPTPELTKGYDIDGKAYVWSGAAKPLIAAMVDNPTSFPYIPQAVPIPDELAEVFKALYFKELKVGEHLVNTNVPDSAGLRLVCILAPGDGDEDEVGEPQTVALFSEQDGQIYLTQYGLFLKQVQNAVRVPSWALGKEEAPDPAEPVQVESPFADPTPGLPFEEGSVVVMNDHHYVFLGRDPNDDFDGVLLSLGLQGQQEDSKFSVKYDNLKAIAQTAKLVAGPTRDPFDLFEFVKQYKSPLASFGVVPLAEVTKAVTVGESVTFGGDDYVIVGAGKWGGTPVVIGYAVEAYEGFTLPLFRIIAPDVLSYLSKSSYAPTGPAPEDPHNDDEPAPEQGSPELSGSLAAFTWLAKKGWEPATQSEFPGQFLFMLGEKLAHNKPGSTRTIIGYGSTDKGAAVYVIETEKGNLNWVTAANAHKKYGTVLEMVPYDFLPKPGAPTPTVDTSSVGYKLGPFGFSVFEKFNLTPVQKSARSPFHVNTPLRAVGGGVIKYMHCGYVEDDGQTKAVIGHQSGSGLKMQLVTLEELDQDFEVRYETKTGLSMGALGPNIDIGKDDTTPLFASVPGSGLLLDPADGGAPDADDLDPSPVKEPPVPTVSEGKHIAAGIIATLPAGTSITVGKQTVQIQQPRVVIYKVMGQYEGYKLAIPKGTVEEGQSMVHAAVKEFSEETGLTCKPTMFLGDFRGNKSTTRLYLATVTGGNPKKKVQPEESEAVLLRPLDVSGEAKHEDEPWWKDLIPKSGNTWQQDALTEAVDTIIKLGDPSVQDIDHALKPAATVTKTGDVFSAPISESSYEPPAKPSTKVHVPDADFDATIPADLYGTDVWKVLYFKCPFPVTGKMVGELQAEVANGGAGLPVGFDASRDRVDGPNFGQSFEIGGNPYVGAGYVSWRDAQGLVHHYMFANTPGGQTVLLAAGPDGVPEAKIASDQTLANAPLDPFYQHPDDAVNAAMELIYQNGGKLPKGVKMSEFKLKWCKQSGIQNYAVISSNMVQDVASMFVGGACSQPQKDAIEAALKARQKQTQKKAKGTGAQVKGGVSAAPPSAAPFTPAGKKTTGLGAPQKKVTPLGLDSPLYTQYVDTPQPFLFTPTTGKISGGSKPNRILTGPGGKQWFAKWAQGEDWRADVEAAAYRMTKLVKDFAVPVGVMDIEIDGKTRRVSYQPVVEGAQSPPSDVAQLAPNNVAELLSQHAADMFMGDHDGHAGNFVMKEGALIPVDRGQAFKFVIMGKVESLNPEWHAPGNFGQGYAKDLLIRWGKGEIEIPEAAWVAMLKAIKRVGGLTKTDIQGVFGPVAEALDLPKTKAAKVVTTLTDRAKNYESDWTKVLRTLRADFKWPAVSASAKPKVAPVFESSPESLGFSAREEQDIADAVASGWQGKTLRIDKDGIEGQEVMVRKVNWTVKPGKTVPATLIHFRVARPAGLNAAKKLYPKANVVDGDVMAGPKQLKADLDHGFWTRIFKSIKSINYHLFKEKDTKINQQTIADMNGLVPTLEQMIAATSDPTGVYGPTNEPNEAVYAMAEQYLQYIGIVNYWNDNAEELLGQHSPQFTEFLYEPPPKSDREVEEAVAPPYRVQLKKQGALIPTATPNEYAVGVSNLNKPVYNSSQQSQFVIYDDATGAQIHYNPVGKTNLDAVKEGVETLKGQAWAIIPGEPSPATVARLLQIFQDATGVDMSATTPEDDEVLYWSRQRQALQGNGRVKPKADHTSVVEKDYEEAMALYRSGDAAGAIQKLKAGVAKKLQVPVGSLPATPEDIAGEYTRGAGFRRHTRIGWDRDKLVKAMGAQCHVAHHISGGTVEFMQNVTQIGALLSNVVKPYYGVTKVGASMGADMEKGGSQGLFGCFRKGFTSSAGMLYFDISLALRLDVYIVGTGDTYGHTGTERYTTPEQWVKLGAHLKTGSTGASSPLQVNVRHDIDLQQYLVRMVCGSKANRDKCIQLAQQASWTFPNGLTAEQVFVA